jgi:hypothetical protein
LTGSRESDSGPRTEKPDFGALEGMGWRQLGMVSAALVEESREFVPDHVQLIASDLVVVVSHDCDVCSAQESEPKVELMAIQELEASSLDGTLTNLKSPRVLQFAGDLISSDGETIRDGFFEARAHRRWWVPREVLLGSPPEAMLVPTPPNVIARWLGRRYDRPAFPTEFNRRISPVDSKITDLMKRQGDLITGLFLTLNTEEELGPEDSYDVVLLGLLREETADLDTRDKADELVAQSAAHLGACEGIDVKDYAVKSDAEISVADLRKLRRLDQDNLSYRAGTPEDLPPIQG